MKIRYDFKVDKIFGIGFYLLFDWDKDSSYKGFWAGLDFLCFTCWIQLYKE